MNYILTDKQPKLPLKYFEEIAAIPHGSGNEAAISSFIADTAARLGLYVRVDEYNNVVVKKQATPGYEHLPALLLQAHVDMVNEKNGDSDHDFEKDGLKLVLEGNILRAEGTTLGADDGKGVAYMLALMDSDSDAFPHPPLEFLFTAGEEIGFIGALGLDCSDLTARRMIGLDAGPEGVVATTSAGAQEVILSVPAEYEPVSGEVIAISARGLLGGHSAMNITDEKGNANKIMGRLLHNTAKVADFRLCKITGGAMFNAIPREADAVIAVESGKKQAVIDRINQVAAEIGEELAASDPDLVVTVHDAAADKMLSEAVSKAVVECLYNVPNGVRMMNKLVPGLPVTSTNMGVVKTLEDKITVDTMLRSSSKSLNDDYVDNICTVGKLTGMTDVWVGSWMPAWPYMADSKMRELAKKLYRERTGEEMRELAVHGGLELGVFSEKMPGMDIVTLGCTSGDEHTVTEWMDIDSYARVYDFMKDFIAELCK